MKRLILKMVERTLREMKKMNIKNILVSISLVLLTLLFIGCSINIPTNSNDIPTVIYNLRDIGPAGGYICYDKGDYSDGWRYLEAAPVSTEWKAKWGGHGNHLGAWGDDIGTGQSNTNIIVNWLNNHSETGCAAQLCDSLIYGGYGDWFLPSYKELYLMRDNLKLFGVGEFDDGYYSSSTEMNENNAFGLVLWSGATLVIEKNSYHWVRAIRKF